MRRSTISGSIIHRGITAHRLIFERSKAGFNHCSLIRFFQNFAGAFAVSILFLPFFALECNLKVLSAALSFGNLCLGNEAGVNTCMADAGKTGNG